jgi:DNA-binding NtrC family response regulator
VPINCGALPETILESELFGFDKGSFTGAETAKMGKLEFADGGTLFLDEVEALTPKAQVSLLRFLQEGEITRLGSNKKRKLNVRVIAATNKDLFQMCSNNEFREDLYYRLTVFPLKVPPLRERKEDIPDLANWLLSRLCQKFSRNPCIFSDDARKALIDYSWPGNIRELRNCLERAIIITQGETLNEEALFLSSNKSLPMKFDEIGMIPLRQLEKAYISWALARFSGNKTRTAEVLGITTRGLYYKLDK